MARIGYLTDETCTQVYLDHVQWCASFLCKLRGLMFRYKLEPGEGLLMIEPSPSRVGPSIHMLFMAFPIAAIWMDEEFRVVDKVLARPWRLVYVPAKPAKYTLEASPILLDQLELGDQLVFKER